MSEGKMFLGWGDGTSEERSAGSKAATTAYVEGSEINVQPARSVQVLLEVEDWKDSAIVYFKLEQSYDKQKWFPLTAGTALSSAVAGELSSEVLPFVQYLRKTTGDFACFEFEGLLAPYMRLLCKVDADAPEGALVLAKVFA